MTGRARQVNRWTPWWIHNLSPSPETDFQGPPTTGYFTRQEFEALPAALQPLVRHLCVELVDRLQPALMARAEAASQVNAAGFARVGEPGLKHANAEIRVSVAKI